MKKVNKSVRPPSPNTAKPTQSPANADGLSASEIKSMQGSFDKQTVLRKALLKSLSGSKEPDIVTLIVTKSSGSIGNATNDIFFCPKPKVKVNQGKPFIPGTTGLKGLLTALNLKQGIPKTVKLTVEDGMGKHTYFPIGVALLRKPGTQNLEVATTKKLFSDSTTDLFGTYMYITFSSRFILKNISKYAVIVQREDGSIGVIDPGVPSEF
jgi:hypothetical protein